MKPFAIFWLTCTLAIPSLTAPVFAQTATTEPAPTAALAAAPSAALAGAEAGAGLFDAPVAADLLDGLRGGSDTVHNDMTLTGATTGNTAIGVATGSNAIGSGAFSGMSGLPVVIQNSGANVLIQNAVILHLEMN
jgi:hypothetical protein